MENKYKGWDIHYRPSNERYYPRYNGQYLTRYVQLMEYRFTQEISPYTLSSETKEGAKEIIDTYLADLPNEDNVFSVE